VAGSVVAAGRPVPGASVSISAAGDAGMRMEAGLRSALADEAGRFRFERLNSGRYTLSASLAEQSSEAAEAVVTADEEQQVQLSLGAGALLRGVVSGLPEALMSTVRVSASSRDYFSDTRPAAGGAFELPGVPEGTLMLQATAGDFLSSTRTASTTVTIAPGQAEATAEIAFEQGYRVDGRVTRGGRPVADATVFASPEAPSAGRARAASARTDETGAYALEGVAEGTYVITAMAQDSGPIRRTVTISGDTTVDLEAPPARIAGAVVETGTGRPLSEVTVRMEQEGGAGMRFATMATTDSSGRFGFEDLEPGRYRVGFQKAAYQVEERELVAAEDAADTRVELRRAEGLELSARDGIFGTPLRGLFVRALDASGRASFTGPVVLDSEGRGEIPALRPGVYELRAQSDGYAAASLPGVSVPSSALALTLTPGGALEIECGPQTLALAKPVARLLRDGRPHAWSVFAADATIPLSPIPRPLENLAPGRYAVVVDGGASREVTVTEGGRAVVALP
jgi:5-hydroxyisourate hydrolase-like protein (transthyretin family)